MAGYKIQRAIKADAESVSSSSDGTGSSASEELFVCKDCEKQYVARKITKLEEEARQRKRRIERRQRITAHRDRMEEEREALWNAPATPAEQLTSRKEVAATKEVNAERKRRMDARDCFVKRRRLEEAAIPADRRQQMLNEWWDGGDSVPYPFGNFFNPFELLKNYPTE